MKISAKGQITVPRAIRQKRGWEPGTRIIVIDTNEGVLLKTAPIFAPTKSHEVFGSLRYGRRPKTLKDMEAGIAAEVKRRHVRNRY
jgi:AbrB family looped-hinge helix DNA binding protein